MNAEGWRVISSEQIIDRPYIGLFMEAIELPDGRVIEDWPMVQGYFCLTRDACKVTEMSHDDLEDFTIRWVSLDALEAALREGRVGFMLYGFNIVLALLAA